MHMERKQCGFLERDNAKNKKRETQKNAPRLKD